VLPTVVLIRVPKAIFAKMGSRKQKNTVKQRFQLLNGFQKRSCFCRMTPSWALQSILHPAQSRFNRVFQIGKPCFSVCLAFDLALRYPKLNREFKMEVSSVSVLFAKKLRKLRMEKGLSQKQLGQQMFVSHSTIARWESGTRLPDVLMIPRLAKCLGVDVSTLLQLAAQIDESPNVILVDDSEAILTDGVAVLEEVLPNAAITGFVWPREAIAYANNNQVALAIVDIELGTASGLDLSRTLLEINPRTNVVFLTSYPEYSLDAWKTGASGFMVKPLTPESVREELKKLRHPFPMGGAGE
jgi:transcriptional regulator with XRE-family HTH domain